MKIKNFIVPIMVVALVTVIIAPPVQAELVTITVILAAAFTTAVVSTEVVKSKPDNEMASKADKSDSIQRASIDYPKLEPAPQ
jgi:hypothetical protein